MNGDTYELELDCKHNTLAVRNTRDESEVTMELPAGQKWRLYVFSLSTNSNIRILDSRYM